MNSDLSKERADSALAAGNNNNKRYPWAFVYMNIVTRALVQDINNVGRGKQISCTQWLIRMACYQLCLSEDQRQAAFMEACHFERSCRMSLKFHPLQQLYSHFILTIK